MHKPFIPALRFRALTRIYDPVVRWTTRERTIKRRLAEGLGSARRILDVGSGTGTLLGLIREIHPAAELVGLDMDPEIIALAREKLGGDVEIVRGDATAPPFDPASFDRVVSSLVFHHLTREQKSRALEATHRLLVPGGELHLADWSSPHDTWMRVAFIGVQLLDGFETTRDNVRGDMPELVRAAGFQEVREIYRQRTPLGSMSIIRGRR